MAHANDLTLYERHAEQWWNPRSAPFRSLHAVNAHRVGLLRDWLGARLDGLTVVDLGCGGGLLAEPLQRAGARVVGVDLSQGSLRAASAHVGGRFVCGDVRHAPLLDRSADVVLLADLLEHLEDIGPALDEAARLLRYGGLCYVNTINRTARARWLAVGVAEGLGLVPRGTHDARLFVSPARLCEEAARRGLAPERIQGEPVDVLRTALRWAVTLKCGRDLSVMYSALFRKGASA